jgi:PD-(D/E)XK nuclease superfamily protein
MGYLYRNAKGMPWNKHSYSAGNTFDKCPLKYYLQKVLGWRERNAKARFEFGHAFESAIQFYHEHWGDRDAAIKHFLGQWEPFRDKPLQYTKVERDWHTCARIGTDWLKLYAIRQPSLPIPIGSNSVFQRQYEKEVFPGDEVYGGIYDVGKLDIIAYVEPEHPLLPKLNWRLEYGATRPIIIDIKTAGQDFPESYGIAAFDAQLRRYSWLTGIRDAALLWFVKKGLKLAKGYSVTLLEDAGYMKAGQEAVIALIEEDGIWLLPNDFMVDEMERIQGQKNGKTEQTNAAKERRDKWLEENGTWAQPEAITKQRLQFNAGFITVESANDAGAVAQDQIIRIVRAWQNDQWPNKFGVRYPNDDRSDPYFQAFVLNNQMFRDQNFTKSDDDIDLFAEDEPDAEEE